MSGEIDRQHPGTGGRFLPAWASELAMRCEFPDFIQEVYAACPEQRRQVGLDFRVAGKHREKSAGVRVDRLEAVHRGMGEGGDVDRLVSRHNHANETARIKKTLAIVEELDGGRRDA